MFIPLLRPVTLPTGRDSELGGLRSLNPALSSFHRWSAIGGLMGGAGGGMTLKSKPPSVPTFALQSLPSRAALGVDTVLLSAFFRTAPPGSVDK